MADSKTFVLIGNFTDNITPALEKINNSIDKLKKNLVSISKATKPLKDDFKDLSDLSRNFSNSLKTQASDIRAVTTAMRSMRNEMGRVNRAYRAAGRNRGIAPPPRIPKETLKASVARPSRYAPSSRGAKVPTGGRSARESVLGDVISGSLISNAIIQGFQAGVGILQQGLSVAFGAFAERAKDQLEDLAAAGGIYSAGQYANIPGFPKTFQDAMQLQDGINKEMAAIASNLPGTTHDYVENSRRLVDTTGQIMARDFKNFTQLAKDLTGNVNISAADAFKAVNVEVAKATTMLEKINPARTVIPMSQLVEDMMKSEKVTIGGLRRYVAFRRGTTFETALQKNIDELNKTGAGTTARIKMIIKVLQEAVPAPMVMQMQRSVGGVVEGFRSAILDPDVGLFGLSRNLTFQVKKFDQITGKQVGVEFSNFFKIFSEVFGNIGVLINNTIMPGLLSLYQPFDSIAKQFLLLRDYSYKIYQHQQEYNAYFENLAAKYGMSKQNFKVFEKGGLAALMDVLGGMGMIDAGQYNKIVAKMEKKGSAKEIEQNMKEIYADIIPMVFKSPFFKNIGVTLGSGLAEVFKQIAYIMEALLKGDYGVSQFTKAFYDAGGMDAINKILMYAAEGIGKLLMKLVELYFGALTKAIGSGNFAAAGVLGSLGIVFAGPAIGIIVKGMNALINAFRMLLASKVISASTIASSGGVAARSGRLGRNIAAGFMTGTPREKILKMRARRQQALGGAVRTRARIFGANQYSAPIGPVMAGFQRPGGRTIMQAELRGMPKALRGIREFGTAGINFAKKLPGLSIALGALDFGLRKASGQKTGEAAGGAAGAAVGGVAGGALGSFLDPFIGPAGTVGGAVIGSWLGDWLGSTIGKTIDELPNTLQGLPAKLESSVQGLKQWFVELPNKLAFSFGAAEEKLRQMKTGGGEGIGDFISHMQANLSLAFYDFSTWINGFGPKALNWFVSTKSAFDKGLAKFGQGALAAISGKVNWGGLASMLSSKITSMLSNAINGLKTNVGNFLSGLQQSREAGQQSVAPPLKSHKDTMALMRYDGGNKQAPLGQAIASEMKHKPPGSKLVIANSSETVIPAAKGYMPKFNRMINAIAEVRYGSSPTPGSGTPSWMKFLDDDYKRNLNKPYNPSGTVKNSGRGGLDTWGGPGAYISPKTLAPVASAGGGGSVNVNSPVTIHQQPGQNAEELAAIVAQKIGDAVAEAKASSMFV